MHACMQDLNPLLIHLLNYGYMEIEDKFRTIDMK